MYSDVALLHLLQHLLCCNATLRQDLRQTIHHGPIIDSKRLKKANAIAGRAVRAGIQRSCSFTARVKPAGQQQQQLLLVLCLFSA